MKNARKWISLTLTMLPLLFGVPALERLTAHRVSPGAPPDVMSVSIFDVGQGDSILAQEGDRQILIDGGPDSAVLEKLGAVMPPGDRSIDLVILTHPHADHLNGLIDVLERYEVQRVLATDVASPTARYRKWRELIAEKDIPIDYPQVSKVEKVGDMEFETLSFGTEAGLRGSIRDGNSDGLNDSSIVGIIKFGSRRFLTMGDATSFIEKRLAENKDNFAADFLKVGHHGSNYSTSAAFLAAVDPRYAAISVGSKNSYGNPAWRVTQLLDSSGIADYRTDQDGGITAVTDGQSLQVLAEKVR